MQKKTRCLPWTVSWKIKGNTRIIIKDIIRGIFLLQKYQKKN